VIFVSLLGKRELAHAACTTGADGFVCKADIDEELFPLLVEPARRRESQGLSVKET
jgi:hypothetical protein